MGNTRYGALAKTKNWRQVIALLASEEGTGDQVAAQTLHAARNALLRLQDDPTLAYCGYLLTHFAWEARNHRLSEFLSVIGIASEQSENPARLMGALARLFTKKRFEFGRVNALSEITEETFLETVQRTLSSGSQLLFQSGFQEIESAFRAHSTAKGFSVLTTTFFSAFLKRTLGYFLSKEIPNHVGPARRFDTPAKVSAFEQDIHRFCSENAKILEQYSRDWYSLHTFQDRINERDARAFLCLALEKISKEIARDGGQA
jgi:hypothetical protein